MSPREDKMVEFKSLPINKNILKVHCTKNQ